MKRLGRPQCPYCGKKVGILNTWTLKKRGEYTCPRCQGLSNVVLDIFVPLFAAIAIVVALFSFIINRVGEYPITLATFLWILGPPCFAPYRKTGEKRRECEGLSPSYRCPAHGRTYQSKAGTGKRRK